MNTPPGRSRATEPGASRSALIPGLLVLAALNLGLGIWQSVQDPAQSDLRQIVAWAADWLGGGNPYAALGASVDYPPWAIVILSPLALLSADLLAPLWIGFNLVLVFALAHRLARHTDEPARVRVALVLLLASTAAAHTLTQFSLLSYALAVAGVLSPSRFGAALLVGLGLMKPQIGAVALLWWLVSRQWMKAALSMAVPAVLTMVFAVRSGVDLMTLLGQYARILASVYGGDDPLRGHTELVGNVFAGAVIGGLLMVPAVFASRGRRRWSADETLEGLALFGTGSLLAVRHLSYDFILLWPLVMAWRTIPFASGLRRPVPAAAFWALSSLLVIGIAGWARAAVTAGAPAALLLLTEATRLLAIGVWGYLTWRVIARRSEVNYW